jgi:hypothetical protein
MAAQKLIIGMNSHHSSSNSNQKSNFYEKFAPSLGYDHQRAQQVRPLLAIMGNKKTSRIHN